MMTERDVHGLAAAYAVDAVDEQEREAFAAHLPACEPCQQQVAELTDAAAALSHGLEVQPPPELRDRVLRLVAGEAQGPIPDTGSDGDSDTTVVPLGPARWRHRRGKADGRRNRLVAAAAAVVVGVWGVSQTLASHPVDQVVNAEDAREYVSPDTPGLMLITSAWAGQAALRLPENLSAPPSGSVYQAWFISTDGEARSAGVLDGRASEDRLVLLEGPVLDATAVGLTVEPEGGSVQPTSDPVAVVALG